MSPEVGDSRDDSRLFLFYVASPSPFSLLRLGRLVFVRAWFAIANLCACVAIVYENEFSHIAPQTQQSSIATPLSSVRSRLLPPLVEGGYRYLIFYIAMSFEVRGR